MLGDPTAMSGRARRPRGVRGRGQHRGRAALLSVALVGLGAPAAAQPQEGAAETPATAEPAPRDPAEAAFARGAELLGTRCEQLKAGYERGDARIELLRALSDCYLIEADLSRANAMRRDAERLERLERSDGTAGTDRTDRTDGSEAGKPAVDLAALQAQWSAACRSFERSHELEPTSGAQLAVALCRLRQGRLSATRDMVQKMLPQLGALAAAGDVFQQNRLALAKELLAELERIQPKLTVHVATQPAPELTLDGQPISADESRALDVGTYRVEARRGEARADLTLALRERTSFALTVTEERFPVRRSWRLATWSLAGGAVAASLVGAGAWWYAERRLDDFQRLGGTETSELVCAEGPDAGACADAASDVNRWRTVRVAGLVTAGTLAAAAVTVYLITPKPQPARLRWVPEVDRGQVALSVRGGF